MYQGCEDREGEMAYSKLDLDMAFNVKMLARNTVIADNCKKLKKEKSVLRVNFEAKEYLKEPDGLREKENCG